MKGVFSLFLDCAHGFFARIGLSRGFDQAQAQECSKQSIRKKKLVSKQLDKENEEG